LTNDIQIPTFILPQRRTSKFRDIYLPLFVRPPSSIHCLDYISLVHSDFLSPQHLRSQHSSRFTHSGHRSCASELSADMDRFTRTREYYTRHSYNDRSEGHTPTGTATKVAEQPFDFEFDSDALDLELDGTKDAPGKSLTRRKPVASTRDPGPLLTLQEQCPTVERDLAQPVEHSLDLPTFAEESVTAIPQLCEGHVQYSACCNPPKSPAHSIYSKDWRKRVRRAFTPRKGSPARSMSCLSGGNHHECNSIAGRHPPLRCKIRRLQVKSGADEAHESPTSEPTKSSDKMVTGLCSLLSFLSTTIWNLRIMIPTHPRRSSTASSNSSSTIVEPETTMTKTPETPSRPCPILPPVQIDGCSETIEHPALEAMTTPGKAEAVTLTNARPLSF
jgi:hypothetical protein